MDEPTTVNLERVADELNLTRSQVESVVALLDEGNTVPFITRYRKERTGNLDEEQIRQVQQRVTALRQLADRAETILRLIHAQGKLTSQLKAEIKAAETLKRLEDLYLPYRPKRKSRAMQARQRGLEPLADRIWNRDANLTNLDNAAAQFIDPSNDVFEITDVLQGVSDILAERISENATIRERSRKLAWQTGKLIVTATKAGKESGDEYRDYFDYSEAVSKIPPHRILALNRGDKAGALRVRLEWTEERAGHMIADILEFASNPHNEFLRKCTSDALQRLIQPSLERELRRELTDRAELHAVSVFSRNLRNLLLQPPLQGQRVLAVDPGFRTGCKIAALDEFGHCLHTDVIYVTGPQDKRQATKQKLADIVREHGCTLIAIGNGTACRETEELAAETIAEHMPELRYIIVNEAGASIYSASTVAREEFPDHDATVRGTISIGRRLQDPLSELVKIDPQHLGVGMYQHDVAPKRLKESLDQVIESCVNFVGVDLNTASASLLRHVSGMNQLIARRVTEWRDQHGRFTSRQQLHDVAGIGDSTFTQSAGFLKIAGGDEPLDSTWIHPESYQVANKVLDRLSLSAQTLFSGNSTATEIQLRISELNSEQLADELEVGTPTLTDICEALSRPGRDPRSNLPGPVFKRGVLNLEDLADGMELQGTILNVVDFGAFVDIGLKDSGLVHISQLSGNFVKSPHDVVAVGDVVTVWVLDIDQQRRRVGLTMVKPGGDQSAKARISRQAENLPDKPPRKDAKQQTNSQKTPKKQSTKNRTTTATPLPPEKAEGRKPLQGFDELKELWKRRQQ